LPAIFIESLLEIQQIKPDLLIVIGTALAVGPFNQIVEIVSDKVPKVLINMENTAYSGFEFDD
jgi:NAD-dependent SIR2 family protein deacetylase